MTLKIRLDPILCDGYGQCAELLPEAVRLDEWGYPMLTSRGDLAPALEPAARHAVKMCPRLALKLVKDAA